MSNWIFMLIPLIFILAFAIILFTVFRIIVQSMRRQNTHHQMMDQMMQTAMNRMRTMQPASPRSLNGMDAIFLPQIYADFPDFNASLAEGGVRDRLKQELSGKDALRIHNIVISGYERMRLEKTVVYQAALEYREGGMLLQKRYCLHYTYLLPQNEGGTVAANCPNCGAPVGSLQQKCEYCDSLLGSVMGNRWTFTQVYEG